MIGWMVEALAASAVLMLAVLALRGPVRRAFGAELAYALWAVPALRLILPPLPQEWHATAGAPIAELGRQASVMMILPLADEVVLAGEQPGWMDLAPSALAAAWIAGALIFLVWQLVRYVRFRVSLMARAVPIDRQGRVAIVESDGATGPLAFGILHRVVAFPPDFAARYEADERDLALAHELGHHARGDLIANWLALAVLAFHWFNPIAWLAYRAFRADQEMANDAGVLARLGPGARHAYGCAIVKAAHGRALTPACHLHTIKDLKGRLRMLGRTRASRGRVALGAAGAMGLSIGALALTASGTQAAERVRAKVENATGVELAALDPVAALQAVPVAIATPAAASTPMPAAQSRRQSRVTVNRDGRTETYEGDAADAYLAAHPLPAPPAMPRPPVVIVDRDGSRLVTRNGRYLAVPAVPSVPGVASVPVPPEAPVVAERNCGRSESRESFVVQRYDGGRAVTVICTDRIEAHAKTAAKAGESARFAADRARIAGERARFAGMRAGQNALATAMASMRETRRAMAANRAMPDEDRAETLHDIDEAIAEMRHEMQDMRND